MIISHVFLGLEIQSLAHGAWNSPPPKTPQLKKAARNVQHDLKMQFMPQLRKNEMLEENVSGDLECIKCNFLHNLIQQEILQTILNV